MCIDIIELTLTYSTYVKIDKSTVEIWISIYLLNY